MEMPTVPAPAQPVVSAKRPTVITVICILGFVGVLFTLLGLSTPAIREPIAQQSGFGSWYLPMALLQLALGIASFIGLWKMRKWGVYLYVAMTVFGVIFDVMRGGTSDLGGYIAPVFIILISFKYFKKMK